MLASDHVHAAVTFLLASRGRGSPGEPRAPVAVCDEHTVERVEKGSAQAGAGESLVRHEEAGAAAEQRVEELGEREALVWDAGGAGEWSADAGNWSGGAAPEGLEEGSATGWARGGVANPGLEPERKGCATNGELTGQTKKRSLDDVSSGAHCRGDNQTVRNMFKLTLFSVTLGGSLTTFKSHSA